MPTEHVDVLIVGAGLSGIAAAHELQRRCPDHTWAMIEARDRLGGTWDLFRYPGIRSDSDMYTLGYSFRPWQDPEAIADGPAILAYLQDTAAETGIDAHIRFGHRLVRADWSTAEARWTLTLQTADGPRTLTCGFLWACTGYYRYDAGYTPDFDGLERFAGEVVHPQAWSDAVEVEGKRVVVIGSGATAMTLVPELAQRAAHVTMLQRTPTYVVSQPRVDPLAERLKARLPGGVVHWLMRTRYIVRDTFRYQVSQRHPRFARERVMDGVRAELGDEGAADFDPPYGVWDQRVCLLPDGDLFDTLRSGRAEIVTDHVDTFTVDGLRLRSGRTLSADLVVTATGLHLQFLGGAEVVVDGVEIHIGSTVAYRGAMLSDVPNAAYCVGYTNASWTLKVEHATRYVCRVLQHMRARGYTSCCPRGPGGASRPALHLDAGYVKRAVDRMPRQGTHAPWQVHNNYFLDWIDLGGAPVEDGVLVYR